MRMVQTHCPIIGPYVACYLGCMGTKKMKEGQVAPAAGAPPAVDTVDAVDAMEMPDRG